MQASEGLRPGADRRQKQTPLPQSCPVDAVRRLRRQLPELVPTDNAVALSLFQPDCKLDQLTPYGCIQIASPLLLSRRIQEQPWHEERITNPRVKNRGAGEKSVREPLMD